MVALLVLGACLAEPPVPPLDPGGLGALALPTEPVESVGAAPCPNPAGVHLNEVVSSNVQGIVDEDGEHPDWIELTSSADVDLDGWGLGQDEDDAWAFPSITLPAGDTLLVFASGNDRRDPEAELHTDFEIDALGESLSLVTPDTNGGCVAEVVEVPRLYRDVSYGRTNDALGYFLEPTPGAPNTTESRPGFAGTPALTPDGGFFDGAVSVLATVPASATALRYTIDGSPPDEASPLLEGALDLDLTAPVPLRVRAFEDGLWPSPIATATYADTRLLRFGVDIIALTADPPDLFDSETGIYEYGPSYEKSYPYFGANFWELWERDVHVEIWSPSGERAISQDAGIQIAGGYSRAFDQRNFELLARSGYGPDTFDAPLFLQEDLPSYTRLYLRNGGDWCGTQLVDATVQALLRDDDGVRLPAIDAQAYEPAMVYINGQFWGLYELKERLDEDYVAAHHGVDPDELDRIKLGWTHEPNWELEQGDWVAFDAMELLATTSDLADPEAWAAFEALVDTKNLAASIVAQGWIANTDWWTNNLRLWRPRVDGGRFRWMVYDFGHGWPGVGYDHLGISVGNSSKGLRIADALENEAFRTLLVNAHGDLLNTSMKGEAARATFLELAAAVEEAMPLQRERWCGGPDITPWENAVSAAATFAYARASFIEADVTAHLAPGGPVSLSLGASPQGRGTFELTIVEVSGPFQGTYWKDVPVTVTAHPKEGWSFTGWSGDVESKDATLVLPMDGDTTVVASFVEL